MDEHNYHQQGAAMIMPAFRIWLCGTFRVERCVGSTYEAVRTAEWGGSSYPRLLLKTLLCRPGRQARREALMELLWPDCDPEQVVQNLNTATTKLRNVLRPTREQESLLLTENDATMYRLPGQDQLWTDVDAALDLLKQAERPDRIATDILALLEEAEGYFCQGPFQQDEEGQWIAGRRATVEQARYRCRLWLTEVYEQQGMPGQATTTLSLMLEEDPFDEDVLCRLMVLLHRQGMTHRALRLYRQACQAFAREALEPTETTKNLAKQLEKGYQYFSQEKVDLVSEHASFVSLSSATPPPLSLADSPARILVPSHIATSIGNFMNDEFFKDTAFFASSHPFLEETKQIWHKTYGNGDSIRSRRQVLYHLLMAGSTALILSSHPLPHFDKSTRFNLSILEELETITASYWRLCANASLDLLGNLAEHFRTVVNLLQRALPRHTTQRLCSLAGETAQIVGKTLFDLQEYSLAWSYYMFSLKASQAASNHGLLATCFGRMTLLLIYGANPQHALPLLKEAHELNIRSRRIAGWLAAVEAEMYAHLGSPPSCETALKVAENISKNELLEEDCYATGFDASRLAGYKGACFVQLHQPSHALPALQQALDMLDPQAIRRKSTLLADMGIAYAQQGHIQQACQLAGQALAITKQTKSRVVLERICTIRSALEAWKEADEIKALDKQLETVFTSTII